jgi:hypothetical protein
LNKYVKDIYMARKTRSKKRVVKSRKSQRGGFTASAEDAGKMLPTKVPALVGAIKGWEGGKPETWPGGAASNTFGPGLDSDGITTSNYFPLSENGTSLSWLPESSRGAYMGCGGSKKKLRKTRSKKAHSKRASARKGKSTKKNMRGGFKAGELLGGIVYKLQNMAGTLYANATGTQPPVSPNPMVQPALRKQPNSLMYLSEPISLENIQKKAAASIESEFSREN